MTAAHEAPSRHAAIPYVVPAWRAEGPAPDAPLRAELEPADRGYAPLVQRGARVKRIPMLDQVRDDA